VFGVVRLGGIGEKVSGVVKLGCAIVKPCVENSTRPMRDMI
jgi:hypothetical protein